MDRDSRLLGGLGFVSRTFEGSFKENPYILDLDANLYIGPADSITRDEHAAIEVIYHFLKERGHIQFPVKELLRNRLLLLDAFIAFDNVRNEGGDNEFKIFVFGTYDGVLLVGTADDDMPAGPCGKSVNVIKRHFYDICKKVDKHFDSRKLTSKQREAEAGFSAS